MSLGENAGGITQCHIQEWEHGLKVKFGKLDYILLVDGFRVLCHGKWGHNAVSKEMV